jgi:hypothetical protein
MTKSAGMMTSRYAAATHAGPARARLRNRNRDLPLPRSSRTNAHVQVGAGLPVLPSLSGVDQASTGRLGWSEQLGPERRGLRPARRAGVTGRARRGQPDRARPLTRWSPRLPMGQPHPVIFDVGDVARSALTASKQGRSVQQGPQPSAQPAATAARHRRCPGLNCRRGGAWQNLSLGHCPCLPRYSADSSVASSTGKDHT